MTKKTAKKTTKKTTQKSKKKPWIPTVGEHVMIRTVTNYYTGRITLINDRWIALDDAAWVAETGRFGAAFETGTLGEVEPYPGPCVVSIGAIADVAPWDHPLPRTVK